MPKVRERRLTNPNGEAKRLKAHIVQWLDPGHDYLISADMTSLSVDKSSVTFSLTSYAATRSGKGFEINFKLLAERAASHGFRASYSQSGVSFELKGHTGQDALKKLSAAFGIATEKSSARNR